MASLVDKLKHSAMKAGAVVGAGVALSLLAGDGLESVRILGKEAPKFMVVGGTLLVSSMVSDQLIPHIVPWVSLGNPDLKKFELTVLSPLTNGAVVLMISSLVSPAVVANGSKNLLQQLAVGGSASVAGGFLAEGMGWVESVALTV